MGYRMLKLKGTNIYKGGNKMSFLKEFKEFALKGNILSLAVGVVIGTSFGKIISSLVTDIFMPILGVITLG